MLRWNVKWCFSSMQKEEVGSAVSGYSSTPAATEGTTAIFWLKDNKAQHMFMSLVSPCREDILIYSHNSKQLGSSLVFYFISCFVTWVLPKSSSFPFLMSHFSCSTNCILHQKKRGLSKRQTTQTYSVSCNIVYFMKHALFHMFDIFWQALEQVTDIWLGDSQKWQQFFIEKASGEAMRWQIRIFRAYPSGFQVERQEFPLDRLQVRATGPLTPS